MPLDMSPATASGLARARSRERRWARFALGLSAILGLVLGSSVARATPATDFSFFGPDAISLDFDEIRLSAGTVLTTQYAGFGVEFSPNVWLEDNRRPVGWDRRNIANFLTGTSISNPSVDFLFSRTVDAAALEFAGNAGNDFLFEAILGGSVVESFMHAQAACCTAQILGFEDIEFDTLRITHDSGASPFFIGDALTWQVVPEPGPALLVALGLALMPGSGRTRREGPPQAAPTRPGRLATRADGSPVDGSRAE
ncbi:MAG TPA: hypothetical protein VKA74_05015 [Myxococcota bacterium]|nr:hypothetical protein [Myxococcota bacterium]